MNEILGQAKTVQKLLKGSKYYIDYYQREYAWQDEHVEELLDDLEDKFLEGYQEGHARGQVRHYPHYFLGSIIVSQKDGNNFVVDGQQRLTTLTLLLIFLRNLQQNRPAQVNIDDLIVSELYGERSFNLNARQPDQPEHEDERRPCMGKLYNGEIPEPNGEPESVQNIIGRYKFIDTIFPEDLRKAALPYFIDWLVQNVHLVEITAYSDDDAYTIFETMNDRGLSLSQTDMLKGYLLANITDATKRTQASDQWRTRIGELRQAGKNVEPDSFKAWLRSQYSTKIRERKKGAKAEDFDRISTEYSRWLRDANEDKEYKETALVALRTGDDFFTFIDRDFDFYSKQYLGIVKASSERLAGLETVRYNATLGFTLQNMLLLAPLKPGDSEPTVHTKLRLVAAFLDILLAWRIWNFHSIAYSTMQYAMFNEMKGIRGLAPEALACHLHERLIQEPENFTTNSRLSVHQQNRSHLHRLLARMTEYVEIESRVESRYETYVAENAKDRYEVEHVWAAKPERHRDEFGHDNDFYEYRNRFGGLLLLPKSFNASFGALPYAKKRCKYLGQNYLAASLEPQFYQNNSGFTQFVARSGLPFRPYEEFKKADLDERGELYRQLAQRVWDPARLLREVGL